MVLQELRPILPSSTIKMSECAFLAGCPSQVFLNWFFSAPPSRNFPSMEGPSSQFIPMPVPMHFYPSNPFRQPGLDPVSSISRFSLQVTRIRLEHIHYQLTLGDD